MPKWLYWVGGMVVLALILYGCGAGPYNDIVAAKNRANREFGVVQTQLQRRADLIPNLVATVRGYATHEEQVFREVTEARSHASSLLQMNPNDIASSPQLQQQLLEAQTELSGAFSRLSVVVENYPQLQAVEVFRDLQAQLEGTENRIATARRDAQVAVEGYNNAIQQVPGVLYASLFHFEPLVYYEASAPHAEQAPTVDFSPPATPAH